MTTYTDEVNIYNPDAISEAIDDAGNAYKSVITEVGSTGVKIHPSGQSGSGIVDYTLIDDDGMEVFEGGKSVAQFGSTSRIGKAYVSGASDNESHMELDFHSLKLIDKEGNEYFHVIDLRGTNGLATIVDKFIGDGATRSFSVSQSVSSEISATDSSDSTNTATRNGMVYVFTRAPAEQATVTITYETSSRFAKAYTFGMRSSGSALGSLSVAEGIYTVASGNASHAEGNRSQATGSSSHAEGDETISSGSYSHSEGTETTASGFASHAEGSGTTAKGQGSHAEGKDASTGIDPVSGNAVSGCVAAHAEGYGTKAVYSGAHAEGTDCQAVRENSHAEGEGCQAIGLASHAQNCYTIAGSNYQTALGKYNEADVNGDYALIFGNGTSDSARSNALAVTWDGSAILQGWAGIIQMFAGTTPPSGWLLCDGAAVSRTTYAALFVAIGTTWGAGDGSTTFNLPDLRGRAPIGAGTGSGLTARTLGGTLGSENIQAHTHSFTQPTITAKYKNDTTASGSARRYVQDGTQTSTTLATASGGAVGAVSGASTGSAGNMQPSAVVNFIIHTGKTS